MALGLVEEELHRLRVGPRESEDPARFVRDAVEIGARVLDREQTEAGIEHFRVEAEKVETAFADKARAVAEFFNAKVDEALGPENGHLARALERHFSDDS